MKSVTIFTTPTCGPCKRFKPELVREAAERGFKLEIVELSADTRPAFDKHGVRGAPTVIVFDGDKEFDRFSGAKSPEELARALTTWGL